GRRASRQRTGFPAHRQAMTPSLAARVRRWIGGFVVLAVLAATMPTSTPAQPAGNQSLVADVDRVGALMRDGRNLDAVDLAKKVAADVAPSERPSIYQMYRRVY